MKGNNKFISKILFKLLLLRGGCSDYTMMKAIQKDKTEVVKLLLQDKRVDPSAEDNYAIRWASANGYTDIVKLLLEDERVDPSAGDNYAIRWASANGREEVVKLLLKDKRVELFAKDEAINCISAFSRNDDINSF